MKIGQLKTGSRSCSLIKPRSIGLGQMEGSTLGSKGENHIQTGLPLLLSNMEGEIILWYRGVTSALTAQAWPYHFCQELTPFIAHDGGPCTYYQRFGWTIMCILTAPITWGDLGKACGGQVRCWPSVIFFQLICSSAIVWWGFSHVVTGIPPWLICVCDWRTEN